MKIQIRQRVFETNSSSTHVLSVIAKSDWDEFTNSEELFIDWWDTRKKFFSREDLWKQYEKVCKEDEREPSDDDFDEWLCEEGFFNYDRFSDEYEILTEEVPDSPYIAVSIFGYE